MTVWTKDLQRMRHEDYDALAARLAEAVRWKEDAVLMCARRQCATRDKRLAESEARAEAAEARVRELEAAIRGIVRQYEGSLASDLPGWVAKLVAVVKP